MYNFIFWFFYRYCEKNRGYKSTSVAFCGVALTIGNHLGAVHSIIRYRDGHTILMGNNPEKELKVLLMIFLIFLLIYLLYFRPRAKEILEKYKDKKPFTWQNILLVILIMVVPLVFAAIVTNMAVAKFKALNAFILL